LSRGSPPERHGPARSTRRCSGAWLRTRRCWSGRSSSLDSITTGLRLGGLPRQELAAEYVQLLHAGGLGRLPRARVVLRWRSVLEELGGRSMVRSERRVVALAVGGD
jgi:hypothetical protein